jgi:hypothetical protein
MESGVDGSTSAEVDGARTAEKHRAGFSCFIAGTCACMKLLQRMGVVPQSLSPVAHGLSRRVMSTEN